MLQQDYEFSFDYEDKRREFDYEKYNMEKGKR
jgi:hypothetical protein